MQNRFARSIATLATAAVLTVSTGAAAAKPNSAAALSVTKSPAARGGATLARRNGLGGAIAGATLINIGILAALTVLVLTVVADDGDSPDSD